DTDGITRDPAYFGGITALRMLLPAFSMLSPSAEAALSSSLPAFSAGPSFSWQAAKARRAGKMNREARICLDRMAQCGLDQFGKLPMIIHRRLPDFMREFGAGFAGRCSSPAYSLSSTEYLKCAGSCPNDCALH